MRFVILSEDDKTCMAFGTKSTPAIDKATTGTVTIPSVANGYTVTRLSINSFYGCSGLTSVTIPGTVLSLGKESFGGCDGLTSVTTQIDIPFEIGSDVFPKYDIPLYIPNGRKPFYELYTAWNTFTDIVENEAVPDDSSNPKAYSVLSKDQRMLMFLYDGKKAYYQSIFGQDNVRSVSDRWEKWNNTYISSSIRIVVFDKSFANYEGIIYADDWFNGFNNMQTIVGIENFVTKNVTSMNNMFKDCQSLTSIDLSHFNTSMVTSMEWMFENCTGLTNLDLSNFDTKNVQNISYMFYRCNNLEYINLSSFNTSSVVDLSVMFCDCSSLTSLDLSHFDTRKVEDMGGMFERCSGLSSINLTNFNTRNVKSMSGMFSGCNALTILDLRYFDTSNVRDMRSMFQNCNNLKTVYISNRWSNECGGDKMFDGCTSIVGSDGTTYDRNKTDFSQAHSGEGGYLTMVTVEGNNEEGELEAYAVLSEENTILTFYYDRKKDMCMGLPIGPYETQDEREWTHQAMQIKTVVFDDSFAAYTGLTSTAYWFYRCTELTTINGITNLKTVNVTDMCQMFCDCYSLTSLDLSSLNTANVENMKEMFYNCRSLTSLDISNFNTSNVTSMHDMFNECSALKTLDVSHFNTASVTDMKGLFSQCSSLTQIDVRNFNTANVMTMEDMFNGCSSITSLDLSSFNTEKVQNLDGMFGGCTLLESLDISNFNTSSVYYFGSLFNGCSSLKNLNLSTFNTQNAQSMGSMFEGCSSLTALDLTSFSTANVKGFGRMFKDCSALANLNLSNFDTSAATKMESMFENCSSLTSIDLSNFSASNVRNMEKMFYGCSALMEIDLSKFDTKNVENMSSMFYRCSSLINLDLSSFNTSSVTNMGGMFEGCKSLTTLNLKNFDTSNVTYMGNMFASCASLTSLDISGFNTSKIESSGFYEMFSGCASLTELDLSSFDTSNATYYTSMFYNCSSLTTIYVSDKWSISSQAKNAYLFEKCYLLTGGMGTRYNSDRVDISYAHIDGGTSNPGYFTYKDANSDVEEEETAYAELSADHLTLMFKYGVKTPDNVTSWDVSNTAYNTPGWYSYRSSITKVVFDESFAKAEPQSCYQWFYGCSKLTTIEGIENLNTAKVTTIGSLYYGCSSLNDIDVSSFNTESLVDMGSAFRACTSLTHLDLSNLNTSKVQDMGSLFEGNTGLVTVDLSGFDTHEVTKPSSMFYNCSKLTTIYVGSKWNLDNATNDRWMFQNCTSLVGGDGTVFNSSYIDKTKAYAGVGGYLTIKGQSTEPDDDMEDLSDGDTFTAKTTEGVTMTFQVISAKDKTCQVGIGSQPAIASSTSGVVTIPSEAKGYKVIKIANRAFKECMKLTQVKIPNTITDIGTTEFQSAMGPFHGCTGITSLDIPSSVTTIGRGAIGHCTSLTTLTIPESVTVIGSNAFDGCTNLKSIQLSPNIQAIQLETFRNCKSLESIEIPAGVTTIGYNAFQYCTSLATVTSHIKAPFAISTSAFSRYDATLYVPTGTVDLYENASGWKNFFSVIKELGADEFSFTTSKGLTYTGTKGQTEVAVKAAKTDLAGDIVIAEVVLNGGTAYTVNEISFKAFEGCTSIEKITMPKSLTKIGGSAFFGCTSLKAFDVAEGTGSLSVADGVLFADNGATLVAYPAAKGSDYEIPATVTSLHDGAFAYAKLTSLTINREEPLPVDKQTFEGIDFENCVLNVPLSTAAKYRAAEGWSLFKHISGETEVTADGATYAVYDDGTVIYTAADKTAISGDYVVPSTITVDGVEMPVKEIAPNAFEDCTELVTVTIPKDIESIGASAFKGCTGLEEIYCLSDVPINLATMFNSRTRSGMTRSGGFVSQFDGIDFDHCILYVPFGTRELYMASEGWMEFKHIVELIAGDANADGEVDAEDVDAVADFIMGKAPEYFCQPNADANNDKTVNAADIVTIVRLISEKTHKILPNVW